MSRAGLLRAQNPGIRPLFAPIGRFLQWLNDLPSAPGRRAPIEAVPGVPAVSGRALSRGGSRDTRGTGVRRHQPPADGGVERITVELCQDPTARGRVRHAVDAGERVADHTQRGEDRGRHVGDPLADRGDRAGAGQHGGDREQARHRVDHAAWIAWVGHRTSACSSAGVRMRSIDTPWVREVRRSISDEPVKSVSCEGPGRNQPTQLRRKLTVLPGGRRTTRPAGNGRRGRAWGVRVDAGQARISAISSCSWPDLSDRLTATCSACRACALVASVASATWEMFVVISAEVINTSLIPRLISAVTAVCSCSAVAIAVWWPLISPITLAMFVDDGDDSFSVDLDSLDLGSDVTGGPGRRLGQVLHF